MGANRDNEHLNLVGTIRARSASETLRTIRPHFRAMGITRIARVTGLDRLGIPVSVCSRPSARSLTMTQGKGVTPELADVSAAMESIELYHAENPPPADLRANYGVVARDHESVAPSRFVPGPFPATRGTDPVLDWIGAENLATGRIVHVPRALIDLDRTRSNLGRSRILVSPNGLASGNTLDEATCHALYEVIERDSAASWYRLESAEGRATEVNPATVDGHCGELLARFAESGVGVRIWDATSSTGIPTFICYVQGVSSVRALATFIGMGACHARDIALSRALTEAAQARATVMAGTRDDFSADEYAVGRAPRGGRLPPHEPGTGKDFHACPDLAFAGSFRADLEDLIRRLVRDGREQVLRVDLTQPSIGIPVVNVIVPGLDNTFPAARFRSSNGAS